MLVRVWFIAYTVNIYSIRKFLWKYKLRGIERKRLWPVSELRLAFPSKDISMSFSSRIYVRQLVVIGVVKKTSKNNGIISCCLGLSLVEIMMTVLNLRAATAELFLTGFYSNFINDWEKFDLYLFIVEILFYETDALFSTDSPVVTLELGSNLNGSSIREGMDVYFECIILANPWVYKVIWRHNVSLYWKLFLLKIVS